MNVEIQVTKEIPYRSDISDRCMGDGDFWGNEVCPYHVERNRYHGKKAQAEVQKPKCTLFGKWLSGRYMRCEECKKACEEALKKPKGWVHLGGDEWACPECGFVISTEGSWEKPTDKYCRECGAHVQDGGDEDAY